MKNSILPLQIFAIIMAIAGTASLAFFTTNLTMLFIKTSNTTLSMIKKV